MKKREFLSIFVFIFIIYLVNVNAEIYFDEMRSVYNIGDLVEASVALSTSVFNIEFFKAYLICGVNELEIYKSIEAVNPGEEKRISVKAVIDNTIVGNLAGECFISAMYGGGEARSQPFRISRAITIELNSDNAVYSPGDLISVSGKAVKENLEPLQGYVDIVIEGIEIKLPVITSSAPAIVTENNENESELENVDDETESEEIENNETEDEDADEENNESIDNDEDESDIEINESEEVEDENETIADEEENDEEEEIIESDENVQVSVEAAQAAVEQRYVLGSIHGEVINGEFSGSFLVPENAPPGTYRISARAYDLDRHSALMSSGEGFKEMKVNSILKRLELDFNSESIVPGSEFIFVPFVYDQADNFGEGDVTVSVFMPDGGIFMENLVPAGGANVIAIALNFTPGMWEIRANINDLEAVKQFNVEELSKVESHLEGGKLFIRNVGNVPYNGPIEIHIGDKTDVKTITLGVGEEKVFRLGAPDGEYEIVINDGENVYSLGKTFLTGRAIGIDDEGLALGDFKIWLWALIGVVVLILALLIIRKLMKRRVMGKIPRSVTPLDSGFEYKAASSQSSTLGTGGLSTSMDKGSRQDSAIIALKIKNYESIRNISGSGAPLESLDKALNIAKRAGAKIYTDNEFRIIILAPSLTKEIDNEIKAAGIAREIEYELLNHNRISAHRIEFGIGIHSGQLGVEVSGNNVKFVSIGNAIVIVKRISEQANNNVLLSESAHRKTFGKIKVDKIEGTNFWQLRKIVDRQDYEDFISKFLAKQKGSV